MSQEVQDAFDPCVLCGLDNLGNTCFANSALQCLANSKPMLAALRVAGRTPPGAQQAALPERFSLLRRSSPSHLRVAVELSRTLNAMKACGSVSLAPRELLQAVGGVRDQFAVHGAQQDSAEWLHNVLDSVDEETRTPTTTAAILRSLAEPAAAAAGPEAALVHAADAPMRCPGTSASTAGLWALWQHRHRVDVANLREEYTNKKWDGPAPTLDAFVAADRAPAPLVFRSPLIDPFRGSTQTEVTCRGCGYVSRTASCFTSLELSFPSDSERAMYHAARSAALAQTADATATVPAEMRTVGGDTASSTSTTASSRGVLSTVCYPITCVASAVGHFFAWVGRGIRRLCCGDNYGPVTLDELLWVHFRSQVLRGSNKYNCPSCRKACEATVRTSLLELPETLVVHLKRFEYGPYWTSKIADYVEFPMDFAPEPLPEPTAADDAAPAPPAAGGADLPRWVASPRAVNGHLQRPQDMPDADAGGPLDLGRYCAAVPGAGEQVRAVSTYSLESVVNHHGSFFGGHYTAFACKDDEGWALHNDHRCARASRQAVASSQAYLLVYRKAAPVAESREMAMLRHKARQYLLGAVATPTPRPADGTEATAAVCYVSRTWLLRLATLAEPGPVLNGPCYCSDARRRQTCHAFGGDVPDAEFPPVPAEGDEPAGLPVPDRSNRHFHHPVDWQFVPVHAQDWRIFLAVFGGGPFVGHDDVRRWRRAEAEWTAAVARRRG